MLLQAWPYSTSYYEYLVMSGNVVNSLQIVMFCYVLCYFLALLITYASIIQQHHML